VFKGVYRPSEDSILLSTSLKCRRYNDYDLMVDFGSGSGVQSIVIASMNYYVVAIDIKFEACINTVYNARLNNLDAYIDVICTSSFLDAIRDDINNIFVASNPPYLPVPLEDGDLNWAGGYNGLDVIIGLLYSLDKFKLYTLYLIISSYTDINKLLQICDNMKLNVRFIDGLSFPGEEIYLLEICKK